jgi:hypothetical protein
MPDNNPHKSKLNEPTSAYQVDKQQGIGEKFDFDKELKKGLTIEEAKEISLKKIRSWWGK